MRQNGHFLRPFLRLTAYGLSGLLLSGCAVLYRSSTPQAAQELKRALSPEDASEDKSESGEVKIANPPAKTIRFDGSEIVLGTADLIRIDSDVFCADLNQLLSQQRHFSASQLVCQHRGVAEQVLWEQYPDMRAGSALPFIANVLSRGVSSEIAWNGMLNTLNTQFVDATLYHKARTEFIHQLVSDGPTDKLTEELHAIAMRLDHPLVKIDALRLMALRELVAQRPAAAESLFMQTVAIAEQYGDLARAAESWLMVAAAANRTANSVTAADAWQSAVKQQLAAQGNSGGPLEIGFWTRVEQQRPVQTPWPAGVNAVLAPLCKSTGCEFDDQSPPELVVWTAIASVQYEYAQPQLALVNFKKAEALAGDMNTIWLRIAQSKCLAALGQNQAAAALLSAYAASENESIASAAKAALGSAKLASGAYQQAAQLLSSALNASTARNWPMRDQAEADLALAMLIVGDTDQGLAALHAVQEKFQRQGDRRSLLQALENERRILELEGRAEAVKELTARSAEVERI